MCRPLADMPMDQSWTSPAPLPLYVWLPCRAAGGRRGGWRASAGGHGRHAGGGAGRRAGSALAASPLLTLSLLCQSSALASAFTRPGGSGGVGGRTRRLV